MYNDTEIIIYIYDYFAPFPGDYLYFGVQIIDKFNPFSHRSPGGA